MNFLQCKGPVVFLVSFTEFLLGVAAVGFFEDSILGVFILFFLVVPSAVSLTMWVAQNPTWQKIIVKRFKKTA